jgi:outer membrane protein assembly factor BamB
VYLGTNNENPRDPARTGDRGVLLCLVELTGNLLWQLVVPKQEEDIYMDWPKTGISSPATVEGDRLYVVDNRGALLCLDMRGLANGNDGPFREEARYYSPRGTNAPATPAPLGPLDADILWKFDLKEDPAVGIWPHDAAHSSPLILGDHLYLNTGNGVDNTHKVIRRPEAPSLVVIDKRTGRLLARDGERMGPDTFHCTWSSPAFGQVDGRDTIVFAGGNGILYGFEPIAAAEPAADAPVATLRKRWQIRFDPSAPAGDPHPYLNNRAAGPANIYGMPVVLDGRVYAAGGGDWFWGKNAAWLKCFRPTGAGDLGTNALVWTAELGRHTMATPAVAQTEGLVFTTDSQRLLHCTDAKTGASVWTHELGGEIWGSVLVADGKLYVGTRRGDFWTLALSREKQVLQRVELGAPMSATPVAAQGTLFVATARMLYALGTARP